MFSRLPLCPELRVRASRQIHYPYPSTLSVRRLLSTNPTTVPACRAELATSDLRDRPHQGFFSALYRYVITPENETTQSDIATHSITRREATHIGLALA